MKNTSLKKKFASVLMTVAAVLVPLTAMAAPGPAGRPTMTYGPDFKGADHVQFNSIVNAPNYGDERAFFTGRDNAVTSGGWSDPINNMQDGHTYKLRIYVHNNAKSGLAAGYAQGVKVGVALPTQTNKQEAVATISTTSANATPKAVTDTLGFKSATDLNLSYVPGSAYLKTNTLNNVKLSDDIVKGGATVGSEAINGVWKGCFDQVGYIYLLVKVTKPVVEKPGITIAKTVAKGEATGSTTTATVAPGDKVSYGITVTNNSKADATNVVVRDVMPAGVTVNGATLALNGAAAQPITNYQQLFSKDGINIGTVKAGNKAVIVVKATVNADATGKECSVSLLNTAYASATGIPATSSSATVLVNKDCKEVPVTPESTPTAPVLPEAGAEGAAAAALGLTAMGTTARGYLRSKRGLVSAVRKTNR